MGKCNQCNKKGIFFKVNNDGICDQCAIDNIIKEKEKVIATMKTDEENIKTYVSSLQNEISTLISEKEELSISLFNLKDQLKYVNEDYKHIQTKRKYFYNNFVEEMKDDENRLKILTKMNGEDSKLLTNANKLLKSKILLQSLKYSTERYFRFLKFDKELLEENNIEATEDFLSTVIELKLPHMDVRELRKRFALNKKIIQETLEKYKEKYTTKTNMNLYNLMVMALEAELQNVLYDLSFSKLNKAIENIKKMTMKYQRIALEGNKSIATTVVKFIGEIEFLYIEAVKIEYEYFIQKERIKDEQKFLREQIRQEAIDRRILEDQKRKLEIEESKYLIEISSINQMINETDELEKIKHLQDRLLKIQEQLADLETKKEEIYVLQNGKAGYVYIISNLGSFGDSIFKIGMTRRLNPQERIDELGSASVPFKFDVHSFIFSDNAPDLEYKLHKELNNKRVNKVNLRKEFFYCTIDELENLVYSIEPSAQFNKTLLAEQFYQSMAITEIPEDFQVIYEIEDLGDLEEEIS